MRFQSGRHVVCSEEVFERRHTMKARWVGILMAGGSVLLAGGAARAFDTGGPPLREERELSGKVVRSEANTLYLEHMGVVVPVEVGRETRFSGVRSADQLAEGQEVRAHVTVMDNGKNVANSVDLVAPPSATRRAPEPATVEFTDRG
jgi:hypothetical protein